MRPGKIICIIIDALRADHLGCYGYPRNTSPNLDSIAREGLIFKWAFSQASHTIPSFYSIFTSRYPKRWLELSDDVTLIDVLNQGYLTAGFAAVNLAPLRKVIPRLGFHTYQETHAVKQQAPIINRLAFEWLDKNYLKDFFMFIHYLDVHGPYLHPEPYNTLFLNDPLYRTQPETHLHMAIDNSYALSGIPSYQLLIVRNKEGNIQGFNNEIRYYIAQYDAGIRYVDEYVGELVSKLKGLGIYDETMLIISSDHGEALGENGIYFFHSLTVTKDQIHVPLIIKPHKGWVPGGSLIETPVGLIDIMPTILELISYDYEGLKLQGESLLKAICSSPASHNRTIFALGGTQKALINKWDIQLKPIKPRFSDFEGSPELKVFYENWTEIYEEFINKERDMDYRLPEKVPDVYELEERIARFLSRSRPDKETIITKGFYKEAEGFWIAPDAECFVRNKTEETIIEIEGWTDTIRFFDAQSVEVKITICDSYTKSFQAKQQERFLWCVEIPPEFRGYEVLKITFDVSQGFIAKDKGLSNDGRLLGIMINRVCFAGDTIAGLRHKLKETQIQKEALMARVLKLEESLREIQGSIGWRLVSGYRRVKDRLLPIGTKRRKLYEGLLKPFKKAQDG
jgi:arylsulfatase